MTPVYLGIGESDGRHSSSAIAGDAGGDLFRPFDLHRSEADTIAITQ